MPSALGSLGTIFMPLEGLVDVAAETERLNKQLEKVHADTARVTAKLDNESFVTRAPEHVVERQRALHRELVEKAEKLEGQIATLSTAAG